MRVRYKKSPHTSLMYRMAYELETPDIEMQYDELEDRFCMCYNLKLIGWRNADLLELTDDPEDINAVDVIVKVKS